jgi:hypothetical protein
MDGNEFDSLTRKLGGLASRRQAVVGMVGAAVAATGLSAAAKNKGKHNKGKSGKGKAHGFSAKDVRKGKGIGAAACNNAGCAGCSDGSQANVDASCNTGVPVCLPGTSVVTPGGPFDFTCGSGGAICSNCPGTNQTCIPNQGFNGGTCDVQPIQCFTGPLSTNCVLEVGGHATCQNAGGPNACGFNPITGNCLPPCGTGTECIADFGPTGFSCTSQTCANTCPNGCCAGPTDPINPPGSCQTGDNIIACGSGGGTCVDCLLTCGLDGSCVAGVCSCLAPPECGALNQPCCAGNTCKGSNVCNNGLCEAPPPPCGPASCAGCCAADGSCVSPPTDAACGTGGAACVACAGKKGTCRTGKHGKPLACRK